ncbi:MAG: tetratricopeptide repeat protein, partial [Candidatus Hodarchaeales archaeon]
MRLILITTSDMLRNIEEYYYKGEKNDLETVDLLNEYLLKQVDSYKKAKIHYSIGMIQALSFKSDKAELNFLKTIELSKNMDDDQLEIDGLNGLALAGRTRFENLEKNLDHAQLALKKAREKGYKHGEAEALFISALIYDDLQKHDKTPELVDQSIDILENLNNPLLLGRCYNLKAGILNENADYTTALDLYERVKSLYLRLDYKIMVPMIILNIGIVQKNLGDYLNAKISYEQAIKLSTKMSDNYILFESINYLGSLLGEIGEFNEALRILEKTRELNEEETSYNTAILLANIAKIFYRQRRLNKAKKTYIKCLETYDRSEIKWDLISYLCDYVRLLIDLGEKETAKIHLEKAKLLLEEHGLEPDKAIYLIHKAFYEMRFNKDLETASVDLNEAYEIADRINNKEILKDSCLYLAELSLEKLKLKGLFLDYSSARGYIEKAEKIAMNAGMKPSFVNIKIIMANIIALDKRFEEAQQHLNIAKRICEENNFIKRKLNVETAIDYLRNIETYFKENPEKFIIQAISTIQTDTNRIQKTTFDSSELFLSVVHMTDLGPEIYLSVNSPSEYDSADLIKMAGFYLLSIGQGGIYHEGFYGPIPFPTKSKDIPARETLIYAKFLSDSTTIDSASLDTKSNNKIYALFCLTYKEDLSIFFINNRMTIQSVIKDNLLKT